MAIDFDTNPADCIGALHRLSTIGYCEQVVRTRLGLGELNGLQLRAAPIYRQQRLTERDPLDSAIDVFLLQGALPAAELDRLFNPADQVALLRTGILVQLGGQVTAQASVYPVGDDLIFSDHSSHQLDQSADVAHLHDRVMYVGTDSRWLARATLRKPVASMLDLCCGSGIHALLAAPYAAHATAVDINPRAVDCTVFNAKLKGLSNLEVLLGDLYAPVGQRHFELITANPPFVPAPTQKVGFRDGGPSGEEVQRRIIEGLPHYLSKGGIAQIVTEFGENDGEPLERRLRQWLGDAPIDIHVLRLRTHAAEAYAIGHAEGDEFTTFLESVGLWAANLNAQGYSRVVSVLLAFQWSHGTPWCRVDDAQPPTKDAGVEVESIFAAERLSRELDLAHRLRQGTVVRTGPVAVFEARTLGAPLAPNIRARLFGQSLSVEHPLDSLELDLLTAMDRPVTTTDILAVASKANVPDDLVLNSLVSLVRKGFIRAAS